MEIISQLFANVTGLATAVFIAFLTSFFTVQSFNNFHEHPENTTRKFYLQRVFFAVLAFVVAFVITELLIAYLAS
jgi:uncharacterized protein YacL